MLWIDDRYIFVLASLVVEDDESFNVDQARYWIPDIYLDPNPPIHLFHS